MDAWNNNRIQFPRLLAEINSVVGLDEKEIEALCESMDLRPHEIYELFDRAEKEWTTIKQRTVPPSRRI